MVSLSGSKVRVPSLRLHKASGQAVVTVRGRDIYCGRFGSPEAETTYRGVVADLLASGAEVIRHHGLSRNASRQRPFTPPSARGITVAELLLAYTEYAERTYLPPSRECEIVKIACRTVRELFSTLPAADFKQRHLKGVRQHWIDQQQARKYINAKIGRIIRIWRWASEESLVPASVWHELKSVVALRRGRSIAKEPPKKTTVPESDFRAAMGGLSPAVRAILELLWLTGARSGEICGLRTCDLVRDSHPWAYCPDQHKNAHREHQRTIFFGPRARAILQPFLRPESPETYLFSPAQVVRAQREAAKVPHRSDARRAQAAATKRHLEAEQRLQKSGRRRPKTSRRAGDCYNRHSLANALRRVCKRAGVAYFNPHRIRHTTRRRLEELVSLAAVESVIGNEFASEETQATLGHSSKRMTQRYGGILYGLAASVMEQHG